MPKFGDPRGFGLFSVGAILLALAIVPVAMTKADAPAEPRSITLPLSWLMRMAPVGAITILLVGAANGTFFSLAPVYALEVGGSSAAVSAFMTATVLGSALMVWPVGRLSDAFDRRILIAGLSGAGVLLELLLVLRLAPVSALPFVGFGIGAATMVLYTLGISHANDRVGPDHVVQVSACLLFLYCIGAIIGPTLASALMGALGPPALFAQNAFLHCMLAVLALVFTLAQVRAEASLRTQHKTGKVAHVP